VTVTGTANAGTFLQSTVGTGIAVTANLSGLTLSSTNYTITGVTTPLTANITAKGVTIAGLTASNKVYDGNTTAVLTSTALTVDGAITGETVTVTGTVNAGTFAQATVGTGIAVTANLSGLTLSSTNYTITGVTTPLTANITAKGVTIAGLTASNKVYDGNTTAVLTSTALTVDGAITGETVTVTGTANAGTFLQSTVGTGIAVTANLSGLTLSSTNYTITGVTTPLTANITAKGVTIAGLTASNKVYDGVSAAVLGGTAALNGVTSGDDVRISGTATGAFTNPNAGLGKSVAVTGLSLSGAAAGNYELTLPTLAADITKAPLTVKAVDKTKAYDGAVFGGGYTVIYTGFVNGETASVLGGTLTFGGAAVTAVNAGAHAIAPAGLTSGNYNITFTDGALTISKVVLTVTAENKTRAFAAANPTLTHVITGFVNNESTAVVSGSPVLSTTAVATSPGGKYPIAIVPGTLAAANYSFTFVAGELTVETNRPPAISSNGGGATATAEIFENSVAVTTVTATDPEGQAVTYAISGGADAPKFTIDTTTGALVFRAAPDFETPASHAAGNLYTVIVQATDAGGASIEQTLSIAVKNVNEAPAGTDKTVTTDEDVSYVFAGADFGFTDVDTGTSLKTVVITTVPTTGSLRLNNTAVVAGATVTAIELAAGKLTFAPAENAFGNAYASFTFQVQDDGGTANGGVDLDPTANTITVNVTAVNDAPVPGLKADGTADTGYNPTASRYEGTTGEDTAFNGTVRAKDVDGDTLFYTPGTTQPANGQLSLKADGSYTYMPKADFNGTDTFTIVVSDGKGGQAIITVVVTVTAVNDAPVLDLDATATGTGYTVSYTNGTDAVPIAAASVTVTDVDNATLAKATVTLTNPKTGDVLAAAGLPTGITATVSGSTLTLTGVASPTAYQAALRAVTFSNPAGNADTTTRVINAAVNDGTADSLVAVASITARILNRPATLTPDSGTNGPSDATYVEGSLPVLVAPRLTLADLDEWQTFTGATVTIASGSETGDRLLANVTGTSITVAYDAAAKRLTLSGTGSRAAYEAVLKSVRFDSLQNPTDRDRALAFAITDAESVVSSNTGVVHVRELVLTPNPNNVSIVNEDVGGQLGVVEVDASGALKDFNFKAFALVDGKSTDVSALIVANPNVVTRVAFLSVPVSDALLPRGELRQVRNSAETAVTPTSSSPLRVDFLELASGVVRYLPLPDEYGVRYAKVAYRVEVLTVDGSLLLSASPDAVLYIAVRNVNDAPIGLPVATASLLQGQSYEIDLNTVFREKDPDDVGKLKFTVTSDPAVSVSITGSMAKVTALAAQALSTSLTFTATDPSGGTGTTSVTFTLKGTPVAVNTPPTLAFTSASVSTPGAAMVPNLGNLSFELPEGVVTILNAKGADADSDTLTYKLSGVDAAIFQVSPSGIISALKALDYEKPTDTGRDNVYNFTVTVEDGRGGSASTTVAVRITNQVEGAQVASEAALNFPVTVDTNTGGSSSVDLGKIFQNLDGNTAVN
jgi:VCBS repeat-containing protein